MWLLSQFQENFFILTYLEGPLRLEPSSHHSLSLSLSLSVSLSLSLCLSFSLS
jgi:hypothetical protein